MVESSNGKILIYGEITEGNLDIRTLELLSLGKKLASDIGGEFAVVLIGDKINQIAEGLAFFGPKKIYKLENPLLGTFKAEIWVEVLEKLCREIKPKIFLIPHSYIGMEVAPRLAFRLNTMLTTDCIDLKIDPKDGLLLRTKAIYGGNAISVFKHDGEPQLVTVREKVMKPAERMSAKGEVNDITPDIDESMVKIRLIERVREEIVELDKADVIISGGRGVGGIDGFKEIGKLRDLFKKYFDKVEIGASRPAVDSGWTSSNRQIGLTGEKVAPTLYIAVGISGAIQHLVGISKSKKIVAINSDEKSNIFNVTDYGVVGDYKKVLPAFMKEWEKLS